MYNFKLFTRFLFENRLQYNINLFENQAFNNVCIYLIIYIT